MQRAAKSSTQTVAKTRSNSARSVLESIDGLPHQGQLWHIHGKVYDLHKFLKHHPGGEQVLLSVKGDDDLTAIFESNHAFVDRANIMRVMEKYVVGGTEPTALKFPAGGFYRTVT